MEKIIKDILADTPAEIAEALRYVARKLRRLAERPPKSVGVVLELYATGEGLRTAHAFPADQCLELANALEELAAKLDAVPPVPHRH